jgi:hypothetical protein
MSRPSTRRRLKHGGGGLERRPGKLPSRDSRAKSLASVLVGCLPTAGALLAPRQQSQSLRLARFVYLVSTLALLGWSWFGIACSFNTGGFAVDAALDPRDSASDGKDFAGPLDQTLDQQVDAVGPCAGDGTRFYCKVQGDAAEGESWTCAGGQPVRSRYCFPSAPCDSATGLCKPQPGVAQCPCPAGIAAVCTFFGPEQQYCAIGENKNGSGTYQTSCSQGFECRSGICAADGFCYDACEYCAGSCDPDKRVKIGVGGTTFCPLGCPPTGFLGNSCN